MNPGAGLPVLGSGAGVKTVIGVIAGAGEIIGAMEGPPLGAGEVRRPGIVELPPFDVPPPPHAASTAAAMAAHAK